MKRRQFIAAGAVDLALPAIARAQSATTLKFIPQIDLSFLDPHWTTAYMTRNHGYMVFDTLYGMDGTYNVSPQMVEGHTVDNDGRLWKLRLRDGLLWHDGTPVLARDCVASIRRWSKRDAFGDALMLATDNLSAPDDRTIQSPQQSIPAAARRARQSRQPDVRDDAGAPRQHRPVQADHRDHRQRPVPLSRRRARPGQPQRLCAVR